MNVCIYGGQFGSEGKGAYAEWFLKANLPLDGKADSVWAEPSPNSGHTCSLGKLRNLPTAAFWSNMVFLGPDSLINFDLLLADCMLVQKYNPDFKLVIHENAGMVFPEHIIREGESTLVSRVASTASGVGAARGDKFIQRITGSIVRKCPMVIHRLNLSRVETVIVGSQEWIDTAASYLALTAFSKMNLFECNQGVMLDPNFGYFPYCTSRSTLPDAALARNGLGRFEWERHMVIRTFPIRTGGNSGPTGGEELQWEDLGVPMEVATVTKRIRRVFSFSDADFALAYDLTKPWVIALTHVDYIIKDHNSSDVPNRVLGWLNSVMPSRVQEFDSHCDFYYSAEAGKFHNI